MEKKELTCICCPKGCMITVMTDGKNIGEVKGYTCQRGRAYAEKEVLSPARILTSTVRVRGGVRPLTSVKTKTEIPKDRIRACMQEINGMCCWRMWHRPVCRLWRPKQCRHSESGQNNRKHAVRTFYCHK